jgi:hypothetical protein
MQSKGEIMEKLKYEVPEIEIIIFESEDVITTSGVPEGPGVSP